VTNYKIYKHVSTKAQTQLFINNHTLLYVQLHVSPYQPATNLRL